MGYYVIMNEIEWAEKEVSEKTLGWIEQLECMGNVLTAYCKAMKEKGSGEIVDSACSYIEEVHMYLLYCLLRVHREMCERIICYAEGFFDIECDTDMGEIAQESLEEQQGILCTGREEFLTEAESLESCVGEISDLISAPIPTTETVEGGFDLLEGKAQALRTKIGEYENAHLGSDFVLMEEMMENLKSLIESLSGKAQIEPGSYQSGDILQCPEVTTLEYTGALMEEIRLNDVEREEMVNTYLERRAVEQRKEEGKNKIIKGALIAGGAVVTIVTVVGSAGTATPVVASIWGQVVVVGSASMTVAYGISETAEGIDLYRLALEGDTLTIAKNPVRDVVFGGNEELYQAWGNTNMLVMQFGMGGSAAYNLIKSEGILAFGAEVGKIAGAELAGELTTQYMIEELGMSETDAWLIGMVTSDATYGSMHWIQGNICQRIGNTNKKTNFENEIPRTGEEWNEFFIEKYGPENVVWGTKGGSSTIKSSELVFGSSTKSTQKLMNQMNSRGWTEDLIRNTVDNPYTIRSSVNKATGNSATVFYTQQGSYVIVDDVTKAIVQISDNINPSTWAPDLSIVDPYIPD